MDGRGRYGSPPPRRMAAMAASDDDGREMMGVGMDASGRVKTALDAKRETGLGSGGVGGRSTSGSAGAVDSGASSSASG